MLKILCLIMLFCSVYANMCYTSTLSATTNNNFNFNLDKQLLIIYGKTIIHHHIRTICDDTSYSNIICSNLNYNLTYNFYNNKFITNLLENKLDYCDNIFLPCCNDDDNINIILSFTYDNTLNINGSGYEPDKNCFKCYNEK